MIQALLREYPHLDYIMVQSIVSAYENGTLDKLLADAKDIESSPTQEDQIITNAITIDDKNYVSNE